MGRGDTLKRELRGGFREGWALFGGFFLGVEAVLAVGAEIEQGAAVAARVDRFAGLAAVGDEQDVHFVAVLGGDGGFEKLVGFFGGDCGGDPFEAAGDPMDVRIHRKQRHLKSEEEQTADGLGPDAFELADVGDGVFDGAALEEFERDAAAVGAKVAEDGLDAGGLDVREAGDANPAFDFFDGGVGDGVPGFEAAAELAVAGGGILVAGVLGEDGLDKDIDAAATERKGRSP
jgi:hypothetical protein